MQQQILQIPLPNGQSFLQKLNPQQLQSQNSIANIHQQSTNLQMQLQPMEARHRQIIEIFSCIHQNIQNFAEREKRFQDLRIQIQNLIRSRTQYLGQLQNLVMYEQQEMQKLISNYKEVAFQQKQSLNNNIPPPPADPLPKSGSTRSADTNSISNSSSTETSNIVSVSDNTLSVPSPFTPDKAAQVAGQSPDTLHSGMANSVVL